MQTFSFYDPLGFPYILDPPLQLFLKTFLCIFEIDNFDLVRCIIFYDIVRVWEFVYSTPSGLITSWIHPFKNCLIDFYIFEIGTFNMVGDKIFNNSPFRRGLCDSVSAIFRQFLGQLLLFFRVSVLPKAGQIKKCLSFDQTL